MLGSQLGDSHFQGLASTHSVTEIMAVRWDDLLELPAGLYASKFDTWPIAEAVLLSGVTETVCVGLWVLQIHGSAVPCCQCSCEDVGRGALGTQEGGRGSWPKMFC